MPFPSKQEALAVKMEMRPMNVMPPGERPGNPSFGMKPEYDPGEFIVYEWNEEEQKTKSMITDLFGVQKRLTPIMAKNRFPDVDLRSALDRLHNFRQIVVNTATGEVFTRSVQNYDKIMIFKDDIQ